jgi:hypothetical protein
MFKLLYGIGAYNFAEISTIAWRYMKKQAKVSFFSFTQHKPPGDIRL